MATEKNPECEIEITKEMIDAGKEALYGFHITEPEEEEMREAVAEVFRSMMSVHLARLRQKIG